MKIKKITTHNSKRLVTDCYVGNGYIKHHHGSLADVDIDFSAARRDEVKAYLERRYNRDGLRRVFSAGTFTTEKIKSVIKDVARTHKVPQQISNYLTSTLDPELTWTDFMKLAVADPRVKAYIDKHPEVIEEILPIMGQPRAAGIHASAIIITPEFINGKRVECFDILPIRKMGELLVSELSGSDVDALGILKNDVLGIEELTRLSDMLNLIEAQYGIKYTILEIASKYMNDPKVFEIIQKGHTQGIFQIAGDGITKFIKRLAPDNINDLIASVALFRPGALESGAAENYVRAKRGEYEPVYLWGTYEVLKDTYAQMVYQEQISRVAQQVGGLSLGDGVDLVKALSKKKLKQVRKFQEKFFSGAEANGCPKDAANKIWSDVEDAAKYSFNASHATTYGLTAYVGAWIKAHYPTVFYTIAMRDQDEDKLPIMMHEIENVAGTALECPHINISDHNFSADFDNNVIYWSLSRIKQLGPKAVDYIINERDLYGPFYDLEDFIKRIFKSRFKNFDDDGTEQMRERCPVTARCMKHLILAGAFDKLERINSILERYGLLQKAASLLGFELTEKDIPSDLVDKHYFWSQSQIKVSGHGSIDFKRIYDNTDKPKSLDKPFIYFKDLDNLFMDAKKGVICASISSVTAKTYKDKKTGENKHFGKIELHQNNYVASLTIWDDWSAVKPLFKNSEGKFLIAVVNIKWSDYDNRNMLQINKSSFLKII